MKKITQPALILTLFLSFLTSCMTLKMLENQFTTPTRVECFSGGQLIYKGSPEDIIKDGNYVLIKDKKTGEYIELEGDCLYYYK